MRVSFGDAHLAFYTTPSTGLGVIGLCMWEEFSYFASANHTGFLGRVVRHRSAKPFTAVRFRQEPQLKLRNP